MFKVLFYNGDDATSLITGDNLRHCLQVQKDMKFKDFSPIAFRTQSGMLFYYDDNIINTFISSEEMSLPELVENCQCKALYRNTVDVAISEHFTIDENSLWKEINNKLVLIDSNGCFESEIDLNAFKKVI
ncbi:hypothetical protein [Flavobacterium sp. HNIBRBA15423]|uniref:hypothetical protein n=1 Tax=Flavobacterium sp. HNIBRBA15423 TaxID=3458683 RepID=UPI00404448C5